MPLYDVVVTKRATPTVPAKIVLGPKTILAAEPNAAILVAGGDPDLKDVPQELLEIKIRVWA